jgi:hypothetical protein
MNYNTSRPQLIIPEYGRHVQSMVAHLLTVDDRDKRNELARSIIEVIGNLNPHLRDVPDFKHKLWDHLFIMSEFQLDVDSPYPIPNAETFESKPDFLEYPQKSNKNRHFGTVIKKMVEVASDMEEGELKEGLVFALANQLKRHYLNWNKDTVEDSQIIKELRELSSGKIVLSPETELDWGIPTLPPTSNGYSAGKSGKTRNYKGKKGQGRKTRYKKN